MSNKGVCAKCGETHKKLYAFTNHMDGVGTEEFRLCRTCGIKFLDYCNMFVNLQTPGQKEIRIERFQESNVAQCWNCGNRASQGVIKRFGKYYYAPYCSKHQLYMTKVALQQCPHFQKPVDLLG